MASKPDSEQQLEELQREEALLKARLEEVTGKIRRVIGDKKPSQPLPVITDKPEEKSRPP